MSSPPPRTAVKYAYRMRRPSIVDEIVGHGADARVALFRHDHTRVLKYCFPDDEDAVQNLEQEKNILEFLGHHPLIAHMHSVSESGLIFEYYPLGSLRDYYSKALAQPPYIHRLRWCQQVIEAVTFIHSKGVFHNDLSTRNILLSSDMNIKICDFGFATKQGESMRGMAETRYNRYRSWKELNVFVTDDLFAVGSLLFEILTGKRPYDDIESLDVERRFQNHVFPSLDSIDPNLARIIDKCWNERYSNVKEIERDFHVEPETIIPMATAID